ncbi:unnamed protein product [Phaeothamnion confervicola]
MPRSSSSEDAAYAGAVLFFSKADCAGALEAQMKIDEATGGLFEKALHEEDILCVFKTFHGAIDSQEAQESVELALAELEDVGHPRRRVVVGGIGAGGALALQSATMADGVCAGAGGVLAGAFSLNGDLSSIAATAEAAR